jgi:small GTP-binding protein
MLKFKVIVVGQKNVGKSSLIRRYTENEFKKSIRPSNNVVFKIKTITVILYNLKKVDIVLNIWDFAGENKFKLLLPAYTKAASAALLLFDLTNKNSLLEIKDWVKIVDENALSNVIKLLIATKRDLETKREVNIDEAMEYCKENNYRWCDKIMEISSKTGENVEEVFLELAQQLAIRNLQICKTCGNAFDKKFKICNTCGEKVKAKTV